MKGIYTCPYCLRSYSVEREGDYMCDCGRHFFYPPMQSSKSSKYTCTAPVYIDSTSKSVRKKSNLNMGRKGCSRSRTGEDCPLARASLVCGVTGLIFFGILSIPALILGFAAAILIADPFYNYRGNWMAVSGILMGLVGTITWGGWLVSLL